mgnify:CR=1 FL=1
MQSIAIFLVEKTMYYISQLASVLFVNSKSETELERWARIEYPNENRNFALSIMREKGRAPIRGIDY